MPHGLWPSVHKKELKCYRYHCSFIAINWAKVCGLSVYDCVLFTLDTPEWPSTVTCNLHIDITPLHWINLPLLIVSSSKSVQISVLLGLEKHILPSHFLVCNTAAVVALYFLCQYMVGGRTTQLKRGGKSRRGSRYLCQRRPPRSPKKRRGVWRPSGSRAAPGGGPRGRSSPEAPGN